VAAEGLDLKRAARVVHYDLPWTPMRLEQREGRTVRLGSGHDAIEVVRFVPPPAIEAALGLSERLVTKAALPGRAGLGAEGVRLWRWQSLLADRISDGPAAAGTAVVRCGRTGVLTGFELLVESERGADVLGSAVGWIDAQGEWCDRMDVVSERMLEAGRSQAIEQPDPEAVRRALDQMSEPVRARLALAAARRWTAAEPDPWARRLAARLAGGVRHAARRRDESVLARLERALAFTVGGHTAGEQLLVRRLAQASEREIAAFLARIPAPSRRWNAVQVRLTGLVLFDGS
jgi:hypothetical protein